MQIQSKGLALPLVALIAMVLVAWFSYDMGRGRESIRHMRFTSDRQQLERQLESLHEDNEKLFKKIAELERQGKIDQTVIDELKHSINDMQMELVNAKEELTFYRSVVAPEKLSERVRVQAFKISPTSAENSYRYVLTLSQAEKGLSAVGGKVAIFLIGTQNSERQQVRVTDLGANQPTFGFKYFQNVDGQFQVPETMSPHQVRVVLTLKDKRKTQIEKTFDWSFESSSE